MIGTSFNELYEAYVSNKVSKSDESEFRCQICILAKIHRVPYPTNSNKTCVPFTLIHYDVWGPAPYSDGSGFKWFVTFIDNCTRMTWLYLIKQKHEVFNIF